MTLQGINLELRPSLYERIKEMADASQKSLADVVIQSIHTGMPPSLEQVPERFHADLKALSRLDDDVLLEVMQSQLSESKQQRYADLLSQNEHEQLEIASEKAELSTMREEADLLMFRRAYAAALLKWRGHQN